MEDASREGCRTEYALGPPRSALPALRDLADKTGLPVTRIVKMAAENRLGELFDIETRQLAYKDGRHLSGRELRESEPTRDPRQLKMRLRKKRMDQGW